MTPSSDGIEFIKKFEGCAKKQKDGTFKAYPDPGTGSVPWTIGWGSTGPDIGPDTVWTQAQCDQRLVGNLIRFSNNVTRMLENAPTTQNQFDALMSFAYNCGENNLQGSTLLKKHKAGDYAGAAKEFEKWNHAAGKVVKGLTVRRDAERDLYLS